MMERNCHFIQQFALFLAQMENHLGTAWVSSMVSSAYSPSPVDSHSTHVPAPCQRGGCTA